MSKNILQVINLCNSAQTFIGGQFAYLQKQGYKMHLICSPHPDLDSFAKQQGILYKDIIIERQPSLWKDIKAFFQICAYIRKHKIDTVVGHQLKARLLTVFAAKLMGVNVIIIYSHGIAHECTKGLMSKCIFWITKFESKLVHKVVCVSNSVAQIRRDLHIDKAKKQYMLHLGTCGGIDTQQLFNPDLIKQDKLQAYQMRLNIEADDFVIGFCGRMVKDKGIIELVEGVRLLRQEHPTKKIKLLMIGSAEKRDSISSNLYDYIHEAEHVVFTGFIPREELSYYYSIMDVLVLPSYREGFGMVTIEAGAMKTPAIVSKSSGCIDSIIEQQTGLYCDITPLSIKDQIEYLFDDTLRVTLGNNAREWIVENFDHTVVWPSLLKIFKD